MRAPADTAMKPAMRAYSMRSWPQRFRQARMRKRKARLLITCIPLGGFSCRDQLSTVLLILVWLTEWDNPVDSTAESSTRLGRGTGVRFPTR
jgi:hypothetical protein